MWGVYVLERPQGALGWDTVAWEWGGQSNKAFFFFFYFTQSSVFKILFDTDRQKWQRLKW